MRALIAVVALGASGCALIDGLGGDDGGGGGGGEVECTPSFVWRDLDSASPMTIDSVRVYVDVTHDVPDELGGQLSFQGVGVNFLVPVAGETFTDFESEFDGLAAQGTWTVSLEDGVAGSAEGTWNSATIMVCDQLQQCESLGDDLPLLIPDCTF